MLDVLLKERRSAAIIISHEKCRTQQSHRGQLSWYYYRSVEVWCSRAKPEAACYRRTTVPWTMLSIAPWPSSTAWTRSACVAPVCMKSSKALLLLLLAPVRQEAESLSTLRTYSSTCTGIIIQEDLGGSRGSRLIFRNYLSTVTNKRQFRQSRQGYWIRILRRIIRIRFKFGYFDIFVVFRTHCV